MVEVDMELVMEMVMEVVLEVVMEAMDMDNDCLDETSMEPMIYSQIVDKRGI